MTVLRVRSDRLRKVIKAAVSQGFVPESGGSHPALVCPVCGHREIYTASGKQHEHEIKKKIVRLRKHGLIFEGRGGDHV